jgi:NOL1/NOP2/fmu family ribosome biogenesis protein
MQEKIAQYVGIKYGEDIANELSNKTTVTIQPPVYSAAIMLRHQEWEKHVRKKQVNIKASMGANIVQLQAASIQDAVAIAKVENNFEDIEYH